ncbi:MAG: malate dehydrogenase [Nitrospirae bacterium]|nr:MAG: malate dehydrogenase [Nitrospirota bacterium]
MEKKRVTIVGAGHVGATVARALAEMNCVQEIVLLDVVEGVPQGKALDIQESASLCRFDTRLTGTNDYDDTAGSAITVITAGVARKPGMSREDLLDTNAKIVAGVTREILARSPETIFIVVSNPVDIMTQLVHQVSGLPKQRVMGMAGVLDTARFQTFVAEEVGCSYQDVVGMVLGGHGDQMVPLLRLCTAGGVPVRELIPEERLQEIVRRTQQGGAEIVSYLKTGSAFYAPGVSVAEMARAIVTDSKRVMPCVAALEGEFGISGIMMGVPCVLGNEGVEKILEFALTEEERALMEASAASIRKNAETIRDYR